MKFKAWIGSSFVLLFALAGASALFYYWDSLRSQAAQMLQTRLNEIELQRFEEDKASQVRKAAAQAANRLSQVIDRKQTQAEAIADSRPLRQVYKKDADWVHKKRAFLKLAGKYKHWKAAFLTDEKGTVRGWTGKKKPPATLAPTQAFQEAKKLRRTAVYFINPEKEQVCLQFTIPCLSERGAFLGVMQSEIFLTAGDVKKITPSGGFQIIIVNQKGQRLSGGPKENFPQNLSLLLQKKQGEMAAILKSAEPRHFKARWEGTSYILACAPTRISKSSICTLLEVTGLESVVGPHSSIGKLYRDPVVITGLAAIVFISLILMFFFSGGSLKVIKKVNRQLLGMLQTGEKLQFVEAPSGGEWEKLTDLINQMIERVQSRPTAPSDQMDNSALAEEAARTAAALAQVRTEMEELHQTYDHTLVQNQEMSQQLDDLKFQNQQLNDALEEARAAPPPPAVVSEPVRDTEAEKNMEELMVSIKEEGELRIAAIYSMSDDLKDTLMVIKNYISSILSSEEGKITDAQQEFLGIVINKSARLERQINDLLDISHMESGITQLYRSRTDLVAMIQDVVLNNQPQADTKKIKIIQEIQTPLPPVMIDGDRMGQVFISLIQHAIKITPVGEEVRISGTETMTDIVVKIRDNGTPLTKEQAGRVFKEFHASDSNAGPDIAGTGLRFPIIQRIVALHNSTITMRGLPKQGNEFVLAFVKSPDMLAPAERETPARAKEPEDQGFSVESYEVKPKKKHKGRKDQEDTDEESDAAYDLTSFMGKIEENEDKEEESGNPAKEVHELPGADDDLNKLLSDIESIDDKME